MKSVTKYGRSVQEATELALEELGIAVEDAVINIVQVGAKGVFGLGGKQACVEVREREEGEEVEMFVPSDDEKDAPAELGDLPLVAGRFVSDLIAKMGFPGEVDSSAVEDGIYIKIQAEKSGAIIGRRGETLDAIQYLTSLIVNSRRSRSEYTRVVIDTENYRSKREEALVRLAESTAGRVLRTGRDVMLEPMNPFERRIIHSALQGAKGVRSHSVGEEPYRKIVVSRER